MKYNYIFLVYLIFTLLQGNTVYSLEGCLKSLTVESAGTDDGNYARFNYNGQDLEVPDSASGLLVYTIDPETDTYELFTFDIQKYGNSSFLNFMNNLPNGIELGIAVKGSVSGLSRESYLILTSFGASIALGNPAFDSNTPPDLVSYYINEKDSFALAGTNYKGPLAIDQHKVSGQGPVTVEYCVKKCAPECESCEGTYDNCTVCKSHETRDLIAPKCQCKDGFIPQKLQKETVECLPQPTDCFSFVQISSSQYNANNDVVMYINNKKIELPYNYEKNGNKFRKGIFIKVFNSFTGKLRDWEDVYFDTQNNPFSTQQLIGMLSQIPTNDKIMVGTSGQINKYLTQSLMESFNTRTNKVMGSYKMETIVVIGDETDSLQATYSSNDPFSHQFSQCLKKCHPKCGNHGCTDYNTCIACYSHESRSADLPCECTERYYEINEPQCRKISHTCARISEDSPFECVECSDSTRENPPFCDCKEGYMNDGQNSACKKLPEDCEVCASISVSGPENNYSLEFNLNNKQITDLKQSKYDPNQTNKGFNFVIVRNATTGATESRNFDVTHSAEEVQKMIDFIESIEDGQQVLVGSQNIDDVSHLNTEAFQAFEVLGASNVLKTSFQANDIFLLNGQKGLEQGKAEQSHTTFSELEAEGVSITGTVLKAQDPVETPDVPDTPETPDQEPKDEIPICTADSTYDQVKKQCVRIDKEKEDKNFLLQIIMMCLFFIIVILCIIQQYYAKQRQNKETQVQDLNSRKTTETDAPQNAKTEFKMDYESHATTNNNVQTSFPYESQRSVQLQQPESSNRILNDNISPTKQVKRKNTRKSNFNMNEFF